MAKGIPRDRAAQFLFGGVPGLVGGPALQGLKPGQAVERDGPPNRLIVVFGGSILSLNRGQLRHLEMDQRVVRDNLQGLAVEALGCFIVAPLGVESAQKHSGLGRPGGVRGLLRCDRPLKILQGLGILPLGRVGQGPQRQTPQGQILLGQGVRDGGGGVPSPRGKRNGFGDHHGNGFLC